MPVVPRYQPQVKSQALPQVRATTDAPDAAFGIGDDVKKANERLSGTAVEYFKAEKEKADAVAVLGAEEEDTRLRNSLLYDEKTGAMTRRGQNSIGIADEYGTQYQEGQQKIRERLNDTQRAKYDAIASSGRLQLNSTLERHTLTQMQEFDDDTSKAALGTNISDTIQNFMAPGKIAEGLAKNEQIVHENAMRQGRTGEIEKQLLASANSKTHAGVIEQYLLFGQVKQAQAYLNANKGQLVGEDLPHVEAAVKSKMDWENAEAVTKQTQGFKLADGSPDQRRIEQFVEKNYANVSAEDREQLKNRVKANANDAYQAYKGREAAAEYQWTNQVLKAFEQKVPLSQVIDTMVNRKMDLKHQADYEDIATKIYSNYKSDPDVQIRLWENIVNDVPVDHAAMIKEQIKARKLRPDDATELYKLIVNHQHRFDAEQIKNVYDNLKTMAEEQIPDKGERAKFLVTIQPMLMGKSPAEAMKIGADQLKLVPKANSLWNSFREKSGLTFLPESKDQAYVQSQEDRRAKALAQGEIENRLGAYVLDTMGGVDKYEARFKALGIKPEQAIEGTPINNAIKTLKANGLKIDRKAIDKLLSRYPDGLYPVGEAQ